MADLTPSRVVWNQTGFTPYQVNQERAQNIPSTFVKTARWETVDGDLGYFAWSTIATEGEENPWVPVEFDAAHLCWTEIRWEHHRPGSGNWVAFQPACQELGLDINKADYQAAAAPRDTSQIPDTTPSQPPSPST